MKTILICLMCAAALFAKAAPADSTKKKFDVGLVIKTNVFAYANNYAETRRHKFVSRYYEFAIEKLFAKRHSIQLSFLDGPWYKGNYYDWFAVIPEYKYFISHKKPCSGYYVGANLKFIHYYQKSSNILPQSISDPIYYGTHSTNSLGVGFINGIQLYIAQRLTLDVFAGLGFFTELSSKSERPNFIFDPWPYYPFAFTTDCDLRMGFNLGFRL